MKQITIADTIGALCSDDYKGINNQYVGQGKAEVQFGGWVEVLKAAPLRASGGGTESIVIEEKACDIRNSKEADINGALQSRASNNVQLNNVVRQQYAVRRLTPLECERLQGLPDGWTLINDKSCSDSARYKAIGNGMAQPCADYVIQRIVDEVGKT